MSSNSSDQVYSRNFNGSKRSFWLVSIATGVYLGVAIPLVYGLIRYYFMGDSSTFSLTTLLYVGLFLVIYIPYSYRTMMKYDGQLDSGDEWEQKAANVTLIEMKEHRRFG